MKKNEQLEQIRKRVSQSVKNEVDEMIAWIDCAYELGYTKPKSKMKEKPQARKGKTHSEETKNIKIQTLENQHGIKGLKKYANK